MNTVKIKSNQYAELAAHVDNGEIQFLTAHSRLNLTEHGELFKDIIKAVSESGKFDNPIQLVQYAYCATVQAVKMLEEHDMLAIYSPPVSAIKRKVAKAKSKKDMDND